MIVLRADLQEAGVKEQIERVRKLLEDQGARSSGIHEWGLRELAYEIEKQRRGFYVLVEYIATAAAVAELERSSKLSDVGAALRVGAPGARHAVRDAAARDPRMARSRRIARHRRRRGRRLPEPT